MLVLRPQKQQEAAVQQHYGMAACSLAVVDNRGIIVDHLGIRRRAPVKPSDLIQGTLDVLILKSLASEPRHGWAIAKRIQAVSGDVLQIKQGSLYPALHRLEAQGLIKAELRQSETGREARFYTLTKAGRAQLEAEVSQWERLSAAIQLTLRNA
jgi:transcriptional regulator